MLGDAMRVKDMVQTRQGKEIRAALGTRSEKLPPAAL